MPDASEPPLSAGFGKTTTTFVVVSSMVGVGILTTSGRMVAALGSNQLMLIVWVLGGLVALCGALTLAELASTWPGAGGEYVILREAYGPLAAFLGGWTTLLVGFAAPIAAASAAASLYLLAPWNLPEAGFFRTRQITASLLIVGFSLVHAAGHRRAIRAQGVLTAIELVVLVAFVILGLRAGHGSWSNLRDRPPLSWERLGLLGHSLVFVAYSYTGWNGSAFLAGEVRNPSKTLPTSIILGTLLVMGLYLGMNVVYSLALPANEIAEMVSRNGPDSVVPIAELAARKLGGERIAGPVGLAIAAILLATVSAYLLTGPRIMFAMARAGQFPRFAGKLTRRSGTPALATASLATVSLLLLWTGSFDQVVIYAGVGLTVSSMLVVASIYLLRFKHPDRPRPYQVPGYPLTPAVYLLGSVALLVGVTIEDPLSTATALMGIVAGWPVYRWTLKESRTAG